MKTVIVIALVLFISGGLVFLQFKNKKKQKNFGLCEFLINIFKIVFVFSLVTFFGSLLALLPIIFNK